MTALRPIPQPAWVPWSAMVLARGQSCVLARVCKVEGDADYQLGECFGYDERNHGLLPRDGRFSLELQRACDRARQAGAPCWERFTVPGGALEVFLEPLTPADPPSIPAVILAAGASRRLGRPKQLVELDGESLLRRICRTALTACKPVRVVLGSGAEAMAATLAGLPVETVLNEAWEEGMGTSIRAGVQALPAAASGVLLLLCDQPEVDAALLAELGRRHRAESDAVIACAYGGVQGTPALFPARCFPALEALGGDQGARGLLRGATVVAVPFPGGVKDVDRPEDLP